MERRVSAKAAAAVLMVLDHVQYYLPGYPLWFNTWAGCRRRSSSWRRGFIHAQPSPSDVADARGALVMAAGSRRCWQYSRMRTYSCL